MVSMVEILRTLLRMLLARSTYSYKRMGSFMGGTKMSMSLSEKVGLETDVSDAALAIRFKNLSG